MKPQLNKIRYFLINMPIRFNFIWIGLLIALLYWWLRPAPGKEAAINTYQPILILLAKIASFAVGALLLISIISTIIAYLRYWLQSKHKKAFFDLNLSSLGLDQQELIIRPTLHHALRPFLGFISGRMILEGKALSKPFVLSSTQWKKNSLFSENIYGTNALHFRDIKEYQVQGSMIYFEDMFRMIRLAIKQDSSGSFYNPPVLQAQEAREIQAQDSIEMDVRIEQMRKVEGEYLNYKQFEYGDDVRRIVWKIYGKNRELVVRNPEIRNPYASEILMYASFQQAIPALLPGSDFAGEMLNYYKNAIWSLFRDLHQKGNIQIHYIPEQKIAVKSTEDADEKVQYQIANALWQSHTDLMAYADTSKGSVFCIHSLSNLDSVQQLLDKIRSDQYVHFVPLSECFRSQKSSWLRKVFFKDAPDQHTASLDAAWVLSPLRYAVQQNETKIRQLLQRYGY